MRQDKGFEVEVTDPKTEERECEAGKGEDKGELELGFQCGDDGGRQENSLGTVCYNSEVLYTSTGWSVHS